MRIQKLQDALMYKKSLFLLMISLVSSCTWLNTLQDGKGGQRVAINTQPRSGYERLRAELMHIQNALKKQKYESDFYKEKKDPRLAYLHFPKGSAIFKPNSTEEMALLPYLEKVNRIEIRSMLNYMHSDAFSEKMALDRALSVKRYLVKHGADESIIAIHYTVYDEIGEESYFSAENDSVAVELFYK